MGDALREELDVAREPEGVELAKGGAGRVALRVRLANSDCFTEPVDVSVAVTFAMLDTLSDTL